MEHQSTKNDFDPTFRAEGIQPIPQTEPPMDRLEFAIYLVIAFVVGMSVACVILN